MKTSKTKHQNSSKEVISINFNPTEKQIEKITNIHSFVDMAVCFNDLSPNKKGFIKQHANENIAWRWAIVSIGTKFQFPVPIIEDENGNMNLYNWQSLPTSFTKEEAALVLCKYYILVFSIQHSLGKELPLYSVLHYGFSCATIWMKSIGGHEELLRYLRLINKKIMSNQELAIKAYNVLD